MDISFDSPRVICILNFKKLLFCSEASNYSTNGIVLLGSERIGSDNGLLIIYVAILLSAGKHHSVAASGTGKTLGNAALITTNANSTNYDVAFANGTNSANTDYLLYSASTVAKDKGAKRGAFYKVTNVDDVWYD